MSTYTGSTSLGCEARTGSAVLSDTRTSFHSSPVRCTIMASYSTVAPLRSPAARIE